jgi:hypothetical protein
MMDWDWAARPAYESERLRIDGKHSPVILYDMKLPRQIEDHEIGLMLSIADFHLDRDLPFLGLVKHQRGTGVIAARHRKAFADWLDNRRPQLDRSDFAVVVVVPEAIFRAVLRVVYRFRAPPLRTLTTPDLAAATETVRSELGRMGLAITPQIEAFLNRLPA